MSTTHEGNQPLGEFLEHLDAEHGWAEEPQEIQPRTWRIVLVDTEPADYTDPGVGDIPVFIEPVTWEFVQGGAWIRWAFLDGGGWHYTPAHRIDTIVEVER